MSVNFVDRVSTYPNRYKVTRDDGTTEHLTLERADEPTVVGTPLNAATFNEAFANIDPDLTGYATESYVNTAVKKAAPRNLLDNSDFTNLVNQRGAESYTGTSQAYDRWQTRRITIRTTAEGLHITPNNESGLRYLYQRIGHNLCGKKITIAVDGMPAGGFIKVFNIATTAQVAGSEELSVGLNVYTVEIPAGYEDGLSILFYIPDNSAATLKWAALYEGEYTAETLPEYQPKGYGVELAECQRYYENSWFPNKDKTMQNQYVAVAAATPAIDAIVHFKQIKRIKPTITLYPIEGTELTTWRYFKGSYKEAQSVSILYRQGNAGFMARLTGESSATITNTDAYEAEGHWEASADL